jgi:tRNA dimethylallyltransferase
MDRESAIFIVGPTGVGKTSLSISLAERMNGEIISSDSMQAYRYMDIISQRPSDIHIRRVPHHLINWLEPYREYSAARFIKEATAVIGDIIRRGKVPMVVGGSGLYIKALIDGLFPSPGKDAALREELAKESELSGPEYLHKRLTAVDPAAAAKIHSNDKRRLIRALEVFHLTGAPISEHKKKTRGLKDTMDIRRYGLTTERRSLYKMIDDRVDRMFAGGIVNEVRLLRTKRPSMTASASLGYREVVGYLEGEYSLEGARELLKKNTRRFAKRQYTWFNADKKIEWIDLSRVSQDEAVDRIVRSF